MSRRSKLRLVGVGYWLVLLVAYGTTSGCNLAESPGTSTQEVKKDRPKRPGKGNEADGGSDPTEPEPPSAEVPSCERVITAEVVAIDQIHVFNRFGAYNPFGMMYALRDDVVALNGEDPGPGNARLRDGKRPRPLVLRANEGDCLDIYFENWINPDRVRAPVEAHPAFFRSERGPGAGPQPDSPATRELSMHVNGMAYRDMFADGGRVGHNAGSLVGPGEQTVYRLYAEKEGTYLMSTLTPITGGQGLGGVTSLGLFGAVNVQPRGAKWYRSQVTHAQLEAATKRDDATGEPILNPDGTPQINYDATVNGKPVLAMLDATNEIIRADLTAIITGYTPTRDTPTHRDDGAYREFTIIFHDEIKAVQAFEELETDHTLHAIADHAAINYGSAAAGPMIFANRQGVGPNADCINCRFEEFFMASWPNGDPALNVRVDAEGRAVEALWPDDPSNVYHSYLRDQVRFRNLHAGPKETHVFHLHGHQWLRTPDDDKSAYTDSQTIGPGEAYTYDIAYGGSGNRNLSPGDAIFHCHLYPHFSGGMWSLWRNHDVFEDGSTTRNLPDGEIEGGTPTPAVVPLPTRGIPPMPTWEPTYVEVDGVEKLRPAMPGYPFYIPAQGGGRAPLPPLDLVEDGGLGRHLMTSAPEGAVIDGQRGRFDRIITEVNIKLLPDEGTDAEKDAMLYHEGGFPGAQEAVTPYGFPAKAYPSWQPNGDPSLWYVNGQPRRPGAPFANPCPPDTPVRTYRVAAIETDIVTNTNGWHDPQGRIFVLEEDVGPTLEGAREVEPLVIRAQSGECLEIQLTNLMPPNFAEDHFQMFNTAGMAGLHLHQVKFDIGSDGAMNGYNYEDGVHAPEEVEMMIAAANNMGGAFAADGTMLEHGPRIPLEAKPHPRVGVVGAQTTQQVYWADPVLDNQGNDRTLGLAFFHDHMSAGSWQQHGLYGALVIEPEGSTWRDPETGETFGGRVDGGPTSYRADILTRKRSESFREFVLGLADFALLYDANGDPINPPTQEERDLPWAIGHRDEVAPEAIAASDPGSMLINYRHAPIPLRIGQMGADGFVQKPGPAGDMANVFSSDVHGDPETPLLRAYRGDRVVMRLFQSAHEEQHNFAVSGQKWLREPDRPDSGYVAAQAIGLSENFTLSLNSLDDATGPFADYLYGSMPTDDLWNGLWGILRTYNTLESDLLPLPSNPDPQQGPHTSQACPPEVSIRRFTVHAITARGNLPQDRLFYNEEYKLYDPDAILFVKDEHLADIRSGQRAPEPLILRAAAGECIQVELINELPPQLDSLLHFNFNPPIIDNFNVNQVRTSNHISLHPQLVAYNVQGGDGANIGYNRAQTVAPGDSSVFRWYAGEWTRRGNQLIATPLELGAVNLRSMADVINHGVHGAIGSLIVEPQGASWTTDPGTDAQATVSYTDEEGVQRSFREFVAIIQDEIALHSGNSTFAGGDPLQPTALRNLTEVDDAEDTGQKGINYRTEPLWARLGVAPETDSQTLNDMQQADLFSSVAHGDPATPVYHAEVGDEMRLRLLIPSGHARQHAITWHGTVWPSSSFQSGSDSSVIGANATTQYVGNQGGLSAGSALTITPVHGAGGPFGLQGDFLLRDQSSNAIYGGTWGIVRVGPRGGSAP